MILSCFYPQLVIEKYSKLREHLADECMSQTHGKQKWMKMGQKQKKKLVAAYQAKESNLWNEGKQAKS